MLQDRRPNCRTAFAVASGLGTWSFPSVLAAWCAMVVGVTGFGEPLFAQDSDDRDSTHSVQIEGHVIGRVWHGRLSQDRWKKYQDSLVKQLGVERENSGDANLIMLTEIHGQSWDMLEQLASPGDQLQGTLFFLQTKPFELQPHTISFRQVKDQKEFETLIRKYAKNTASELIGKNDRFEARRTFRHFVVQEDPDKEQADSDEAPAENESEGESDTEELVFSFRGKQEEVGQITVNFSNDGMKFESVNDSTFFRYHDGVMYAVHELPALHDIKDLPGIEELTLDESTSSLDVHAELDFRDVPIPLREFFWRAIQASTNGGLEKLDDETDLDFARRRAIGRAQLELVRMALLDIDTARASVEYSEFAEEPLRATFSVQARKRSRLERSLGRLPRGGSQINRLRTVPSPLSLSTSLLLDDWVTAALTSTLRSIRFELDGIAEEVTGDEQVPVEVVADALTAIEQLGTRLAESADSGNVDLAVRIDGSSGDGFVIVGAVRAEGSEQLMPLLQRACRPLVLRSDLQFQASELEGRRVFEIGTPEGLIQLNGTKLKPRIAMAADKDYLWFAIGGENTSRVLLSHLEKPSESKSIASAAGLFNLEFNLESLLKEDDANELHAPDHLLADFEEHLTKFFRARLWLSQWVAEQEASPRKGRSSSFSDALLKPGQSGIRFNVSSREGRLDAELEIGKSIVDLIVAHHAAAKAQQPYGIIDIDSISGTATDIETHRLTSPSLPSVDE